MYVRARRRVTDEKSQHHGTFQQVFNYIGIATFQQHPYLSFHDTTINDTTINEIKVIPPIANLPASVAAASQHRCVAAVGYSITKCFHTILTQGQGTAYIFFV